MNIKLIFLVLCLSGCARKTLNNDVFYIECDKNKESLFLDTEPGYGCVDSYSTIMHSNNSVSGYMCRNSMSYRGGGMCGSGVECYYYLKNRDGAQYIKYESCLMDSDRVDPDRSSKCKLDNKNYDLMGCFFVLDGDGGITLVYLDSSSGEVKMRTQEIME